MDMILGCTALATGGYWVTFQRPDGYVYCERWDSPPAGVHVDRY